MSAPGTPLNPALDPTLSLDDRYLDFRQRTQAIFEQYPQLEGSRYRIFKHIVVQREVPGLADVAKHWVRPVIKREQTAGPLAPAEVLIWLESQRSLGQQMLLPVYHALVARGLRVQVMVFRGPNPPDVPAVQFHHPAQARSPGWADAAWGAFRDALGGLDAPSLARAFHQEVATVQSIFGELDRVLGMVQPRVVVQNITQLPGGGALAVTAPRHGAQALLLQHGLFQVFFTPITTDFMGTWGESSNEIMRRLGEPDDKLVTLGSPRHDAMQPGPPGAARRRLLAALSLPDRPTLVFFSNGNDLVRNGVAPAEAAAWLDAVAAQMGDRFNIVVRLHPNEDGSLYAGCPHLTITRQEVDLATTLDGCDVVGSLCSTVLYEGLLYHKPIWQLYADHWPDLADNWKQGLATRIASQAELAAMVQRTLDEGAASFFDPAVVERVFANHGRSAEATADFIQARLDHVEGGESLDHPV